MHTKLRSDNFNSIAVKANPVYIYVEWKKTLRVEELGDWGGDLEKSSGSSTISWAWPGALDVDGGVSLLSAILHSLFVGYYNF